ncbi:hypothetical protein INT43_002679 [Umbelopsis isabellina]|uniref:BHLH domain-containing protein n=1 Tax=Mortierella isabellina TaxID=91625 RepID=A0A8H7Q7M1_MORIS|nr:hypothetical protein INT43_002679 [Umbelopsis isabellina]
MNQTDDQRQVAHLVSSGGARTLDNDGQNVTDLFDLSNNINYLFSEGSGQNYSTMVPGSGMQSYTYGTSGSTNNTHQQANMSAAMESFSARAQLEDMHKVPSTSTARDLYTNKEDILTPLMSPARTPSFPGQHETNHLMNNETHFSPLASPAMIPQNDAANNVNHTEQLPEYMSISAESMQEHYRRLEEAKLALEEQLWELKSKQPTPINNNNKNPRKRPSTSNSTAEIQSPLHGTMNNSSAMAHQSYSSPHPSPQVSEVIHNYSRMSPATPASLMNMTISPSPSSSKKNRKRNSSVKATNISMPPPPIPSPSIQPMSSSRSAHSTPPSLKPRLPSVSASPRTLKPLLTSPTMTPTFGSSASADEAARILAAKSNYQNLREGKTAALGINFSPGIHSGIEIRRSAHKAAEQKRRDNLKEWFDRIRIELEEGFFDSMPHLTEAENAEMKQDEASKNEDSGSTSDAEGDGNNTKQGENEEGAAGSNAGGNNSKQQPMSKVLLLQYSYEYILKLKSDLRERDDKIDNLEAELSKR